NHSPNHNERKSDGNLSNKTHANHSESNSHRHSDLHNQNHQEHHSDSEELYNHEGNKHHIHHAYHEEQVEEGIHDSHHHMNHTGHGGEHGHHHHGNFKKIFFNSLPIGIIILVLSPLMGITLPLQFTFPYSDIVVTLLATVLFFYGGKPFYEGAADEFKQKAPGMMALVTLGISV